MADRPELARIPDSGRRLTTIERGTERFQGMSSWTLRTWVREGRLSSYKIGKRVFLDEDELDALLEESYRPALRPVNGHSRVVAAPVSKAAVPNGAPDARATGALERTTTPAPPRAKDDGAPRPRAVAKAIAKPPPRAMKGDGPASSRRRAAPKAIERPAPRRARAR